MQDPDQGHHGDGAPPEWEVVSGPGGQERERASLREMWQRRSARGRAVIAATTVAVLALGGGTVAYAAGSGDSGASAGADGSRAASSSPSSSPSPSSSSSPDEDKDGRRHGHGMWFGLGGEAAHGEATVKDPDSDKWVVRIWQFGTVEEVDGDQVEVKSEDGVSWTWTVDSDTTVHRDGESGSGADALKKGDEVSLAGTRDGDTNTAERVASGTFDEKGPGRLPGFGHHGRWGGDDDTPSPRPSESGADT